MPHKNDGQPSPGSVDADNKKSAKSVLKRFNTAEKLHQRWRPQWEEAYMYSLPNRLNFGDTEGSDVITGDIYDETAVVELPRFASRLVNGMFPPNMDAFKIVPGPEHPNPKAINLQKELDGITAALHLSLRTSTFHAELHEANHDVGIGTGTLFMEAGTFPGEFTFKALPLTTVAILNGPDDKPGMWFRWSEKELGDIGTLWPDATIPQSLRQKLKSDPTSKVKIVEACIKEYNNDGVERGTFYVIAQSEEAIMVERKYEGLGSLPFLSYRWSTSAGEVYGRGPLLNVMPAVITANLTVELILQNAQISIGGIWTYDHDGVFNPDNIVLEPGTFIPKARGSVVESLVSNQRFDVSQLVLDEMRKNIKAGLFAPDANRNQGRTPPSATEIADDNVQMAESMGAVTGRLATELLYRVVQRGLYIYGQQGLIPKRSIPRIDGRQYVLIPTSPLLRAQQQHEINNFGQFMGQLQAFLGETAGAVIPPADTVHYLAELNNIPSRLIPEKQVINQALEQIAGAAQEGQLPQG
jgi:hypothetical protein